MKTFAKFLPFWSGRYKCDGQVFLQDGYDTNQGVHFKTYYPVSECTDGLTQKDDLMCVAFRRARNRTEVDDQPLKIQIIHQKSSFRESPYDCILSLRDAYLLLLTEYASFVSYHIYKPCPNKWDIFALEMFDINKPITRQVGDFRVMMPTCWIFSLTSNP